MVLSSLAILIPTWDRPSEVCERLSEIALQFGEQQTVHVQVNPGSQGLADIHLPVGMASLTASENQANIGFVANILNAVMHVQSEWVWILGDDDSLQSDCSAILAETITQATADTIAIVHNQWNRRPLVQHRCDDCSQLLSQTIFGDILFVSGTVWRRSYFLSQLELFTVLAFSCASQIALLLDGLERGQGHVLIFNRPLINYQPVHRWSRLQFVQRVVTLLDLDLSRRTRQMLARLMFPQWQWASHSAWHEVAAGDVAWQRWLQLSCTSLLRILAADPMIPCHLIIKWCRSVCARWIARYRKRQALLAKFVRDHTLG